jgi:hypothetical protein
MRLRRSAEVLDPFTDGLFELAPSVDCQKKTETLRELLDMAVAPA